MPFALLASLLLAADAGFTFEGEEEGYVLESRAVVGSPFAELRLTGTSTASPEAFCNAVFGAGKFDPEEPDLKSREVLRESAHERVTHDLISPPVVSDREYTVRTVRTLESAARCTVKTDSANDLAPPAAAGRVVITRIHALWVGERQPDGKTRLSYQIFTDPAGSVPAFLVEGSRRKLAVKWLKMIAGRAEKAR